MTEIIDGYAQADIWATRGDEIRVIFVETPNSLTKNAGALERSFVWLQENYPECRVDLTVTAPR